jgi:hypothetical protein
MRTKEPSFIIVESREGAVFIQADAEIPSPLTVVMLVDESEIDWERDGLTDEAIAITVRSRSRITAYRELRKQALDVLGVAVGPLTVKRPGGEEVGTASKLGIL